MVTFTELMQQADDQNRLIAEEEKKRGLRIGEGALAGGAQFLISSALGLPMLPAAFSAGKTAVETAVKPETSPEKAGLAGALAGIEKGLPYLERAETAKRAKEMGLVPSELAKGEVTYKKPGLTLADLQGISIPGLTPTYTIGKTGASVRLAPKTVARSGTTLTGMTEAQAKQRVSLLLSKSPSLYGAVTDDAAKNGWLSAFNKLKAKGYID
jgi:hypothetical protein